MNEIYKSLRAKSIPFYILPSGWRAEVCIEDDVEYVKAWTEHGWFTSWPTGHHVPTERQILSLGRDFNKRMEEKRDE